MWCNYPRNASTFSNCPCGRMARRGDGTCVLCLQDRLVATGKVSYEDVVQYMKSIQAMRAIEYALVDAIGEDKQDI